MAELPRYQEMGLIAADQPRIQFAETQEQARFAGIVNRQLDRLSSFAFGIAAEKQSEENKLVGIQMRAELEGEVQKQLSDIKVRMETGQLNDIGQVQQEIQAMQGLVKPLAEIDINQANALMNSIASGGRQLIAKSADTQIKLYQEQVAAQVSDMLPAMQNNISTIYETTFLPEDIQQQKGELRNKLYAMVATTSPALVPAAMKEFESRWNAARDEALIGYFTSPEFGRSPASGVRALRSGNAGKYTKVWNSLGVDEQNSLVKKYITRDAEAALFRSRANADAKAQEKTNTMMALGRVTAGDLPVPEFVAMVKRGDISPTNAEFVGVIKGEVSKMKEDSFANIQTNVIKGIFGESSIDDMVNSGTISVKQGVEAKKLLVTNMDRQTNDAFKYITDAFVPDPMSIGDRNSKQRAANLRNQLVLAQQEALAKGEAFNPMTYAISAVEQEQNTEAVKKINRLQGQLEREFEKSNVDVYREDYTRKDLEDMGLDSSEIRRILSVSENLRKAR